MTDFTLLPILLLADQSANPQTHIYAALNGRPRYLDTLLLSLGMQAPLSPNNLNQGEHPTYAALTTGQISRVENQATAMYLQKVSRPGHLITLEVKHDPSKREHKGVMYVPLIALLQPIIFDFPSVIDPGFVWTLILLVVSRFLSIASLRARMAPAPPPPSSDEGSESGDVLIPVSEDGWVRLKGDIDDIKAVAEGGWLRRPDHPALVNMMDWIARLLVYVAVVVLSNSSHGGKFAMIVDLFLGHGSLALANARTKDIAVNGRVIKVSEGPGSVEKFSSRREMAEELVKEVGRSDFAVKLGMIDPAQVRADT